MDNIDSICIIISGHIILIWLIYNVFFFYYLEIAVRSWYPKIINSLLTWFSYNLLNLRFYFLFYLNSLPKSTHELCIATFLIYRVNIGRIDSNSSEKIHSRHITIRCWLTSSLILKPVVISRTPSRTLPSASAGWTTLLTESLGQLF